MKSRCRKEFEDMLKKQQFSNETIEKAITSVNESGVNLYETLSEQSVDL